MKNVTVGIPVRNQKMFLGWCLDSVLETKNVDIDIHIVDDNSDKETRDFIHERFVRQNNDVTTKSNIKIAHTQLQEQSWLSKNWNMLIEGFVPSQALETDYICLLNSDTIVSGDWLKIMMEYFKDDKVIAVGPSTSCCWGKQRLDEYHKIRYNIKTIDQVNKIQEEVFNKFKDDPFEYLGGVGIVGFCLLIDRRKVLENNLLFDENFKGPGNEADWSIRCKKLGFRSVWAKQAYVHHFGRVSFNGDMGHEEANKLWNNGSDMFRKKWNLKPDQLIQTKEIY